MNKFVLLCAMLTMTLGCDPKDQAKETPKEEPKEQPKEAPKEKIKITMAFQPQENPEGLMPNAKKLEEFIESKTDFDVEIFVPTTYAAVVEAMRSKNADVAYLSAWPYLKAHVMADADLLLVEERNGQPFYYSQFYVLKDSKIKTLKDVKGKTIAFTSPTSTSGYLFPMAELVKEKVFDPKDDDPKSVKNFQFAGGYEAALKTMVNGKVDVAAASDYAFERYLTPEEQAKVRVLHKQGPVPTHGIAVRADMPMEQKEALKNALLELNKEENKELLKSVYGAEKLVPRSHYDHTKDLEAAEKLIGHEYPMPPRKAKQAPIDKPIPTGSKVEPKKPATSGK